MGTTEDTEMPIPGPSDAHPDANALPSTENLKTIGELPVFDRHGQKHAFKDILVGPDVGDRVLVIFTRHFYCPVRTQTALMRPS